MVQGWAWFRVQAIQQWPWSRDGWCPRQTRPLGGDIALPRGCNTTHPGKRHPPAAGGNCEKPVSENGQGLPAASTPPHRPPLSWALCPEKQCCKEEAGLYLLMQQGGRHMETGVEPQGSCPRPTPGKDCTCLHTQRPQGSSGGVLFVFPPPPSLTPR